jgi:hypothetical protein
MGRSRGRTGWSCRDWSHAFSRGLKSSEQGGWSCCPRTSRAYELPQRTASVKHHSSWSMGQSASLHRWRELSHPIRRCQPARWSVRCRAPFGKGHSKLGIWCYVGSKATRIATSYHRHGTAPSSSRTRKVVSSPIPGTSNNDVISTLKKKESSGVPNRKNSVIFPLQLQGVFCHPTNPL